MDCHIPSQAARKEILSGTCCQSLGRCSCNLTGIGSNKAGWGGWVWFRVIWGAIRINPIRASVGPLLLPEAPRQMGRLISRKNGTCHPDPSGHVPPHYRPSYIPLGSSGGDEWATMASTRQKNREVEGVKGRGGARLNVMAY